MHFLVKLLVVLTVFVLLRYLRRIITKLTQVKKWDENVNPHGDLEAVLPGFWRVQSTYRGQVWNMYIYQLMRHGLLIINPMIVRKEVLDKILKIDQPKILVTLSDNLCPVHTKDVYAWKQKFPDAIFTCPDTGYRRFVRDIPLVEFRDLTVEIQIHYDDVQVIFPTEDRTDLAFLLQVKDDYQFTDYPRQILVLGDIINGPSEPNGDLVKSKSYTMQYLSRSAKATTATVLHRTLRENVIAAVCPAHGQPIVDAGVCSEGAASSSTSSSSSSSSSSAAAASVAAGSDLAKIAHSEGPLVLPERKPKEESKAYIALLKIANQFGPAKITDEKKKE